MEPISRVDYPEGKLIDKEGLSSIENGGFYRNSAEPVGPDTHNFNLPSELYEQENPTASPGGLYNGDDDDEKPDDEDGENRRTQVKSKIRSLSKSKWVIGGAAGGGGLLIIFIIALIILAGAYKVVDFAEHVAVWQFARTTSQMAENTANLTEEEMAVNSLDDSAGSNSLYSALKDKYDSATGQVGELWSMLADDYSPNKIISNYGNAGALTFNEAKTKLGRTYIKSVTIKGNEIPLEDASLSTSLKNKLIPGYSFKNQLDFSTEFVPQLQQALEADEYGPIVRGLVSREIRQRLGIGLVAWNIGKFAGKNSTEADAELTREQAAASEGQQLTLFDDPATADESVTTATTGNSAIDGGAQKIQDQYNSDIANDTDAIVADPNDAPSNVSSLLSNIVDSSSVSGANGVVGTVLGAINPVYKYGVPLCLIYTGSLQQAGPTIDEQTDQLERDAVWTQAAAAQEKDGSNVNGEAVGATDWKLGDVTQSNAEKRASGIDVNTSDTLSTEASPTGQYTYSIADYIPVVGTVADTLSQPICSAITNLYVGIGLGVVSVGVQLIAAVTTGGGSEAGVVGGDAGLDAALDGQLSLFDASEYSAETASQSPSFLSNIIGKAQKAGSIAKDFTKSTAKQVVSIGALTLLAKQLVVAEMGGSHSTTSTGQPFDDNVDDGTNAYASEVEQKEFLGAPMTDASLGPDYTANQGTLSVEESQGSLFDRYASLNNPNSLLSNMAMEVGGITNDSLAGLFKDMGTWILDPFKGVGSLFSSLTSKYAAAATPVTSANTYYGNVQFGYTQQEKSLMDSCPAASHDPQLCSYQPLENQLILDESGNETNIAQMYGTCFTSSIGTLLSSGDIQRTSDGDVIANQGLCSPDNLGPDSPGQYSGDSDPNSPNQNDMIFRYRVAMNYINTLKQLNDEQTVSSSPSPTSPSLNECGAEEEESPGATNQSFFTTIGKNICDKNGNTFTPYGVSIVDDLEAPNWCTPHDEAATDAQIEAAAQYWHVNSIRLQVSEDHFVAGNNCVSNGVTYTPQDAMARLGTEINEIEQAGKVPIVNDDTELTGNSAAPTQTTIDFWNQVTAYLASQNNGTAYDNVIFDIFNEPLTTGSSWLNGGVYQGTTYLGMQQVVNAIRSGSNLNNNLIFVEGQGQQEYTHSASLNVLDNYQLTGTNLVYDYHHVNLDNPESDWKDTMGLDSSVNAPIVDGEWTQYDSTRNFECYASAPSNVSTYFNLMQQNNIGMIFWSLEPGVGVINGSTAYPVSDSVADWFPTDPSGYSQPDNFSGDYSCSVDSSGNLIGLGAGSDVMQYFEKYSGY